MRNKQPRIQLVQAGLTHSEAQATLARMAANVTALEAQHRADALERATLEIENANLRKRLAARTILAPADVEVGG